MNRISLHTIALLIGILMIGSMSVSAQKPSTKSHKVSGIVRSTTDRTPISFANVYAVTERENQTDTLSQVSDQAGRFIFALESGREYRLVATYIGMVSEEVTVHPEEYDSDHPIEILLEDSSTELDEVKVVAAKPLFRVDVDRISYSVHDDPSAQTSTVLDMLRKVPLVTVDGQDKIQVKGSSAFKIYMNGKPSKMMDQDPAMVLRSIPASMVKNIEVITDPGVKYDAEGVGAILNIVTESKQSVEGLAGSVNLGARYTDNHKVSGNSSISLTGKRGKLGFSGMYNFNYNPRIPQTIESTRISNAQIGIVNTTNESDAKIHLGDFSASYDITPHDLVTADFSLLRLNSSGLMTTRSDEFPPDDRLYNHPAISTRNESDTHTLYSTIESSADYQHTTDRPGELLTISYRYAGNPTETENLMDISMHPASMEYRQQFRSQGNLHEHTGQIDYVRPLGKKHSIETGIKYIARLGNTDPTYLFREGHEGEWKQGSVFDKQTAGAGAMRYRQQIVGVYASYALRTTSFGFKTGVRGEYGLNDVSYPKHPSGDFKNHFMDWVPEVNLSYNPSPTQQFGFVYRFNVARPNISQLNPTHNQVNLYMLQYGNPNLENEHRHSATLSFSSFGSRFMIRTSIIAQLCDNAISQYSFLYAENPGLTHSTWANIGHNRSAMLTLYTSYMPAQWLRLMGGGMYGYYDYESDGKTNNAENLYAWRNSSWGGQLWAQAMLTLPNSWTAAIMAGYVRQAATLNVDSFDLWWNNINVTKKCLKDKLSIGAYVSNPFTPVMKINLHERGAGFDNQSLIKRNSLSVGLNITYNFGQMKQNVSKTQRTIVNDDLSTSKDSTSGQGSGTIGGGN